MSVLRKVELSDAEDDQIVRIPHDLRMPGTEAVIRREGHRIILEPIQRSRVRAAHPSNQRLLDALAMLEPMDEEIGPIEDYPPRPVEL